MPELVPHVSPEILPSPAAIVSALGRCGLEADQIRAILEMAESIEHETVRNRWPIELVEAYVGFMNNDELYDIYHQRALLAAESILRDAELRDIAADSLDDDIRFAAALIYLHDYAETGDGMPDEGIDLIENSGVDKEAILARYRQAFAAEYGGSPDDFTELLDSLHVMITEVGKRKSIDFSKHVTLNFADDLAERLRKNGRKVRRLNEDGNYDEGV